MEVPTTIKRTHGRWKEPQIGYTPDINIRTVTAQLKESRGGQPFFSHLTVEREVRICVRYLTDPDYRLTKIAQEIRTRPSNLRLMFGAYGVDIINRRLITR